jgi:hypothetical protein
MNKAKLLATLIIPLLLASLAAYSYAHFTDTVVKKYRLHVQCAVIEIKSYKAVSRYDDDLIEKYPPDDVLEAMGGTSTITLSTDKAFPGWYVWVGLLIKNQGSFPGNVHAPIYGIEATDGIEAYTEEYFYGPYMHGDFVKDVWGDVRWQDLEAYGAPPGDVPPPILLEPDGDAYQNKMVLWIYLELRETNGPTDYFTVEIEITVNVEALIPLIEYP